MDVRSYLQVVYRSTRATLSLYIPNWRASCTYLCTALAIPIINGDLARNGVRRYTLPHHDWLWLLAGIALSLGNHESST